MVAVSLKKKNFFQAEDGIRDVERSRGLGDVYKRQCLNRHQPYWLFSQIIHFLCIPSTYFLPLLCSKCFCTKDVRSRSDDILICVTSVLAGWDPWSPSDSCSLHRAADSVVIQSLSPLYQLLWYHYLLYSDCVVLLFFMPIWWTSFSGWLLIFLWYFTYVSIYMLLLIFIFFLLLRIAIIFLNMELIDVC